MKQLNARRSTTLLTLSSASNTAKSTTSGTSFSTGPTTGPTDAAHSRIAAAASSTFPITSVAWAPSCGRLIATGGRDGYGKSNLDRRTIMKVKTMAKWTAVSVADFDQHKSVPLFSFFLLCIFFENFISMTFFCRSAVGRVEWNITA